MTGARNLKSFWLIVLLIAETVQGCTPDLASVASARLLNIVAECGASAIVSLLHSRRAAVPAKTPSPPVSPDPFEDVEPDEVCLASFGGPARLAGSRARDTRETRLHAAELARPPLRSARCAAADRSFTGRESHPLILSLCRLTC